MLGALPAIMNFTDPSNNVHPVDDVLVAHNYAYLPDGSAISTESPFALDDAGQPSPVDAAQGEQHRICPVAARTATSAPRLSRLLPAEFTAATRCPIVFAGHASMHRPYGGEQIAAVRADARHWQA
jgi:hypothetical protein